MQFILAQQYVDLLHIAGLPAVHSERQKYLVSKPPVERYQVGISAHLVAQPVGKPPYISDGDVGDVSYVIGGGIGDVDVGFSDVCDAYVGDVVDPNVNYGAVGCGVDDGSCLPVMPEKARGTVGQPD